MEGIELPIKDKNGLFIKIGDFLNIKFGDATIKYLHENVEVYFNKETLQVCVKGGSLKPTPFPTSLTGYVKPEYEILNNDIDYLKAKQIIAVDLFKEGKITRPECLRHEIDLMLIEDSGSIKILSTAGESL